jgi:cellobiose-specific phosphotransferase system component IIC
MAAAVDLEQAAKQAWDNLAPLAVAGTLQAQLLAFVTTIAPEFEEAKPGDHPTANWIAILWAFATSMDPAANNWSALKVAADYVYRLCFMTNQADTQGMITALQAQAVLDAYNAEF